MQGGGSVLGTAVSWAANLVTGSLATAVAVLAIASLGVAMIRGEFAWRHTLRTVLGCFVLFGAPVLAGGIWRAASGAHREVRAVVPAAPPIATPTAPPQFDPYAGAALPH